MNKKFLCAILAITSLSFTSCTQMGTKDNEYLGVQIEDSKMWSLMDVGTGKLVMSDEFFAPSSRVVKGSFFVEEDNGEFDLYNLSDTKNKLNRNSYSVVTNFNRDGYAIVRVKDEPWQIIDTQGVTVATLDKTLIVMSGFSEEGMALIMNKDGMFGYVNTQGGNPIKPRYKYATIFSDGIAFVLTMQGNDHNYLSAINPAGETVFTFSDAKYSDIGLFDHGYVFAVEGDHTVLLDKTGKKVMTVCNGTSLYNLSYHDGKIIYRDDEFYGVKSIDGKILIRAKYQNLKFQSNGELIAVNSNGKYGVVTADDEIVTPFDYDMLEYVAPGRYITKSGNINVLIDNKGKEIGDQAFERFSNRTSSSSENSLTVLISADNNSGSQDMQNALGNFFLNLLNINMSEAEATDSVNELPDMSNSILNETDYDWLLMREATPEDVFGKTKSELRIMRNYIFARHGYAFKSEDLRNYFSQFVWYKPLYTDVSSQLSPVEIKNVDFIKRYE